MFRPRTAARKLAAVFATLGLAVSLAATQAPAAYAQNPYDIHEYARSGEKSLALQKFYSQRVKWDSCSEIAKRS